MASIWILLGSLVVLAALRYRQRLRAMRAGHVTPAIDDAAIQQIIQRGSLHGDEEGDRLDMKAAALAEEEFWDESWDEPEEYRS